MNRKMITLIIGLMSVAVIGLVWLQMGLIRTSIQENEARFDNSIFRVLNAVAARVERAERRELFNFSMNGFVANYYQKGSNASIVPGGLPVRTAADAEENELLDRLIAQFSDTCSCLNCRRLREEGVGTQLASNYRDPLTPIGERIDIEQLRKAISQELSNNGISTEYSYGIYSQAERAFVIYNGNFVASEGYSTESLPDASAVSSSKYRVTLFDDEDQAPSGMLMMYFPSRSSVLWSTLWLNFSGALLFALVILLCFGYTLMVIYRQKQVSEMKNDFINNMTHEFKTPIATISLASDSITNPKIAGDPTKVARFANIIKQENKRMNSQVEKVLQMALIDRSEFKLKLSPVDLHEVITRAVENIGLQVEPRDGSVQANLQATQAIIEADLTHVSSMINNLLDNANKYSPEKPEISVFTRDVRNGVEVTITDKGIGMSKEARKHIFDKFYRVHTGNLHDVKGFGLGLSYVKAMVTAHKGTIEVKSELGKGSSFILFLPHQVETRAAASSLEFSTELD